MKAMTIFYQECPVCGRSLRIPAKYFGRLMSCGHCQGEFHAGKEQLPAEEPQSTLPELMPAAALPQFSRA